MAAGQWFSSAYAQAVCDDGPQGFWRLSEASGAATAADSSGFGRSTTYTGSPTLGVTGMLTGDGAMTLNGSSQYTTTATVPTNVTNNYSLECLMKLPAVSNQLAFFAYNGRDVSDGWGVGIGDGTGLTGLKLVGLNGSVAWMDSGYTFADTSRHHVVMLRDNGTTKFYVDGAQTGSTSASIPLSPSSAFTIGAELQNGTTFQRFFSGTVDEVAIYNRVLPTARITAHFNAIA